MICKATGQPRSSPALDLIKLQTQLAGCPPCPTSPPCPLPLPLSALLSSDTGIPTGRTPRNTCNSRVASYCNRKHSSLNITVSTLGRPLPSSCLGLVPEKSSPAAQTTTLCSTTSATRNVSWSLFVVQPPSVSVMPVSILALQRLCLHFCLHSPFGLCCCQAHEPATAVTHTHAQTHTYTDTHMHLQLSACCLMFHPHTVAVEAKRAGSIKQRTDSPAAYHASNCGFITDRADQYGTLDSAQRRMI